MATRQRELVQSTPQLGECLTRKPVQFRHGLCNSGLFNDDAIAQLIEKAKSAGDAYYTLGALDRNGYGDKWHSGMLSEMAGKDVLTAISNGRLWLQLQQIHELAPDIHQLAADAFEQLKHDSKDFSYNKLTSNLLISSPAARVLCHLDCAEVILWHLRGRKRVYLYDFERHGLIGDEVVEGVILRESEEEIAYRKDWDDNALVFDLEPGDAANWPHFWPHRVDNVAGLNVSLQTEFYSADGLRNYGVRFANGLLRRKAGMAKLSTGISGGLALAKCGLGLAAKKLGVNAARERTIKARFTIDPSASGAIELLSKGQQSVLEK